MSLDIIKVGENGQLEFDFESLEALTNATFVYRIKDRIKGYELAAASVSENETDIIVNFMTKFRSGNLAMSFTIYFEKATGDSTVFSSYAGRR